MSAEQPADRVSLDALLAHRDWVRALARRLVLDENDADDVVQETWRMAIEKPPRHAESPRGWLATVVRNAARMSGRSETRRAKHEAATPERAPTPSPADLVAAAEMQTRLARAVLELDEPYRSTVLYRFNEGLEASEIAARLGVPVETVRTRLKRAIEKLRERMDVDLGDDRDAWCLLVLGVRANDVAHLAPTAGATAGGVAAGIAGGLAMAATTKVLVAAVLVAGAAWWAWPKSDAAPAHVVETANAPVVAKETPKSASPRHEPRTKTAAADATTPAVAAEPPEIPLGPDVVHGRVIDDETDAPVANAMVSLVWEFARMPETELSAVSRADGTFRIAGTQAGQFSILLLQADGYAETLVDLPWRAEPGKHAKNDAGDVGIFRGKRVVGRVLATDGKSPVAGARLRFSTSGGMGGLMWINHSVDRGAAGADGTFAIERVAPSPTSFAYTVFAVAPGGIGWTKLPSVAGRVDAKGVEIVLRPCGAATVTVRDESGAAKVGVRVVAAPRFEPLGPNPEWDVSHDGYMGKDESVAAHFAATTDARGVARFTSLPTVAERPLYEFVVYEGTRAWKSAAVAAGADVSVDLVLSAAKTWSVAGFVHAPDGAPIAGAAVTGGWGPGKATSDADGRFRIDGLDPSWEGYYVTVTSEGRVKAQPSVKHDAKKDVIDVDVVLAPGAPVEGRVVDQDGKPVMGVSVSGVTTEADGKFVLPSVETTGRRLAVMPPQPNDEWTHPGEWPIVRGGDKDVVVVLPRSPAGKARLVAEVVDDAGAPLTPTEIMVIAAENDGKRAYFMQHGKTELGAGRVVVERMKPGRWRLWVHVADKPAAVVGVEVRDGDTDVNARVVFGRGVTLRGRVELADTGAAMPRFVGLRHDEWTEPQWGGYRSPKMIGGEGVAADGTFEFSGVGPGRWRLRVDVKGALGETIVDVPSGGDVTAVVVLAKAAVVTFRLAAPSPTDVVQFDVASGGEPWRCVMRHGRVKGKATETAQTLRPGTYRWRVTFPSDNTGDAIDAFPPVTGEVTLGIGESVVVDVPVPAK